MGLLDLFRRRQPEPERRASGAGYTAEVMAARESWIAGTRGVAELSATTQACVSLWEGALAAADVDGTETLCAGPTWRLWRVPWRCAASTWG